MIKSIIPKLPYINKDETIAFYSALGFALVSDYTDYLIMCHKNVELHFFLFADLVPSKSDFMIYIRIEDGIQSMYDQFLPANPYMATYGKINTKPWGQIEFSMIDPAGTCLTFGQGVK